MLRVAANSAGLVQSLTEPLSTAFELLTKIKAQQGQQAADDSAVMAATGPAGAAAPTPHKPSALTLQLLQLESQV
jgi:hypothetical protein